MNILTAVLTFCLFFSFQAVVRVIFLPISLPTLPVSAHLSAPPPIPGAHSAQAHGQAPFYLECTLLCSPLDGSRHPVSLSVEVRS